MMGGSIMLAIVKEQSGAGYVIMNLSKPIPKENEVLIKVKAVGICGSDITIFKGLRDMHLPMIPGHEFAGEIVEIGKEVTNYEIGDRVAPSIVRSCGQCSYCKNNLGNLCDNIIETGIHVDGAFAEYVAVPEDVIHILPDSMTFEEGASIDPIACAYHAFKEVKLDNKTNVAILGQGAIGLYAMQIARLKGASRIICIGKEGNERRLELAKDLGADDIINLGKEKLLDRVGRILDGKMPDIVIDATGSPDGFQLSIELVKKKGAIIIVGIPNRPSIINASEIVRKEIQIIGSICYTKNDFTECIVLVESKKIKTKPIISHAFDLENIDEALRVIEEKKGLKIILYP